MPKYRSQFGQDAWVAEAVFPDVRGGYFVELGAGDGVYLSNTYVLEHERGWQGLCIEPTEAAAKIRQRRTCQVAESFVDGKAGPVEFVDAGYLSGIGASFSKSRAPEAPARTVEARPLADLLREAGAPTTIQYLSLDTEGSEFRILEPFPFEEFRIQAITVEHNHHAPLRDALRTLLTDRGYERVQEIAEEDWWIHRDIADDVSPACRDTALWEARCQTHMARIARFSARRHRLRVRAGRPRLVQKAIDVTKRRAPWVWRLLRR